MSDYLSFEALRDNREMLLAFRDANYVLTVLAFNQLGDGLRNALDPALRR